MLGTADLIPLPVGAASNKQHLCGRGGAVLYHSVGTGKCSCEDVGAFIFIDDRIKGQSLKIIMSGMPESEHVLKMG